jgi:hypothetical protein
MDAGRRLREFVTFVSHAEKEYRDTLRKLRAALEARAAETGGQRLASLILSLNCDAADE